MENEQFDDLVKRLETTRLTRGGALRALVGGAAVLLCTTLSRGGVDARRKRHNGVSSEAVTYNPPPGGDCSGFVGKGDVQLAFGWNNDALQKKAKDVTFAYIATDTYDAVCTFITGEGTRGEQTHNVSHTASTTVNASIAYETRQEKGQKQITGFNLKSCGTTTETGEVPVVDGPCMGNEGHEGLWSSVTPGDSTGGLYASYQGGEGVLLPITPVV